jgi:hypothetical protein
MDIRDPDLGVLQMGGHHFEVVPVEGHKLDRIHEAHSPRRLVNITA